MSFSRSRRPDGSAAPNVRFGPVITAADDFEGDWYGAKSGQSGFKRRRIPSKRPSKWGKRENAPSLFSGAKYRQ